MTALLVALGLAGTAMLARLLWLIDPWLREAVREAIDDFDRGAEER